MNKKKTKSTNWGSKWICLFCWFCFFFFFLSGHFCMKRLVCLGVFQRAEIFCYDATKPDIANVYLGCWYTWTRITVCWRFELRWISNQNVERYLLYFGGVSEGFGQDDFHLRCNPQDSAWKSTHPVQLWSGVLDVRLGHFPFPRSVFLFFFSLETPPSFESVGLEGYNPLSNS